MAHPTDANACPPCPWCGGETDAEYVDIGVGHQQVTPFECGACSARQWYPSPDKPLEEALADKPAGMRAGFMRGHPELDGLGVVNECCQPHWDRAEKLHDELERVKYRLGALEADPQYVELKKNYETHVSFLRNQLAERKNLHEELANLKAIRDTLSRETSDLTKRVRALEEAPSNYKKKFEAERRVMESEMDQLKQELARKEQELIGFRGRLGQHLEEDNPAERFKNLEIE